MNSRHVLVSASALFAVLLFAASPRLNGQAAPAPTPSPSATPESKTAEEETEIVALSPFVVQGEDEDTGYAAKATLAGTRIRTELKDVGASVSAVTKQFLQDTNSTNIESLLVYTPNTEVAGQGGNFLGQGDGAFVTSTFNQEPIAKTRVRGLTDADNTRDFYLSDIPWDSYNIGRVDLQRGANSILFGIGSPAGIVNASLNSASFKDSNKVEFQVSSGDSESSLNSTRAIADFNKVLIPRELAVRASLLRDEIRYRQDPAYRDDHRVFFAGRWDPSFLNKGGASHTSLRANFEKGNIDSNLPRTTPPLDAITLWFTGLNKQIFDTGDETLGTRRDTEPALDRPGNLSVFAAIITNNSSGAQQSAFFPVTTPGETFLLIGPATFNEFAPRAGLPFANIGGYKAQSITDRSIFDYKNNLLDGPNKREFNNFEAYNIALSQTFLNDKLGIELAYDEQDVRWGNTSFLNPDNASITVDVMQFRPFNATNPDAGRPMVASQGGGAFWHKRTREVMRATAFADIDFADISGKDSALARLLGRNTITAVAVEDERDNFKASFRNYVVGDSFSQAGLSGFRQDLYLFNYLGPTIRAEQTSPSGLNLIGIKGKITPTSTTVLLNPAGSTADNPLAPITVALPVISNQDLADSAKEYNTGNKFAEKVTSKAAVWQGHWFDGMLVPMVGWREDKQTVRSAGTPPSRDVNRRTIADLGSPAWFIPGSDADITPAARGRGSEINSATVTSRTYSLVTHLPKRWQENLPGHMDVSLFYNKSANVKPEAGRRDLMGDPLPNPAGDTKEYGIAIRGFDDKVSLRIARYETKVKDVRLADNIPAGFTLGVIEAWGQNRAFHYQRLAGDLSQYFGESYRGQYSPWSGTTYGFSSSGQPVTFRPAGPLKGETIRTFDAEGREVRTYNYNYSQAELDATYAKQQTAVAAWFANPLPDKMITFWGLTDYKSGPTPGVTAWDNLAGPLFIARHDPPEVGFVVTGDSESEGYEIELIANPIKGLNLSVNVSKTTAVRKNLAKSFVDWVEARYNLIKNTPVGDMRMWGNGEDDFVADPTHGSWTVRGYWDRLFMPGYRLFRTLEGADTPELQPWALNAVGSYTFQKGTLRNLMVGGGYRWASANTIGFAGKTDANGVESYDISKPYKGAAESVFDLWLGYSRQLNDRFKWRIQLNVRNAFANDDLIPVTRQVDGTAAAYRIPEPRTWALTNTVEF